MNHMGDEIADQCLGLRQLCILNGGIQRQQDRPLVDHFPIPETDADHTTAGFRTQHNRFCGFERTDRSQLIGKIHVLFHRLWRRGLDAARRGEDMAEQAEIACVAVYASSRHVGFDVFQTGIPSLTSAFRSIRQRLARIAVCFGNINLPEIGFGQKTLARQGNEFDLPWLRFDLDEIDLA